MNTMKNLLLSLSLLLLFSSSFAFVATDTGVTFRGIANAKILARRLRVSAQSATPQQETPSPADQDSGVTFRGIVNAKILARRLRLSAQTATTHRNGITMCAAGEDSGKVFDEASVETLYLKQSGKTREQFLKDTQQEFQQIARGAAIVTPEAAAAHYLQGFPAPKSVEMLRAQVLAAARACAGAAGELTEEAFRRFTLRRLSLLQAAPVLA